MTERTNPFSSMTFSKSNSEQDSTSTSQENTPQRRGTFRHENVRIQPDVLNINQTVHKDTEHLDLPSTSSSAPHHDTTEDINQSFHPLLNLNGFNENSSNHSIVSEDHILKECVPETSRRYNEWNHDTSEEHLPKYVYLLLN